MLTVREVEAYVRTVQDGAKPDDALSLVRRLGLIDLCPFEERRTRVALRKLRTIDGVA